MALDVRIIAHTRYVPDTMVSQGFNHDPYATDSANLSEVAGRLCYQSWSKPNPRTRANADYLNHIIEIGHESVLEHGTVSILFTGVSRSFTHELVRHRHFSYSQLSQRYCPNTEGYVTPPLFEGDEEWQGVAQSRLASLWAMSAVIYDELVELAEARGVKRKQAREAARAVLPNMTGTQIVVSGNHRSWREFIQKRATVGADAEIRRIAVRVFELLRELEPALYQDGSIDGDCVVWA